MRPLVSNEVGGETTPTVPPPAKRQKTAPDENKNEKKGEKIGEWKKGKEGERGDRG